MPTVLEFRAAADAALLAGDAVSALRAFVAVVRAVPSDFDARLRTADCLRALGELDEAKQVYLAIAENAAKAGHPLKALVALKVLASFDDAAATPRLTSLDDLYGKGSGRLGRGVRIAAPDLDATIEPATARLDWLGSSARDLVAVVAETVKLASDFRGVYVEPETLAPIPVLSELRQESFDAVASALKLLRLNPGDRVVSEGDTGQAFFVVVRGSLLVSKMQPSGEARTLATLGDGAIFGEMALVSSSPRSATVSARTSADVLVFDREALMAATESLPRQLAVENAKVIRQALDLFARERLLQNVFQTSAFFKPFDRDQRLDVARRFVAHVVAPGTTIIREGQEGKGLFLLLDGEVDVSRVDGDEKVLLATLRSGDVFGEISLLRKIAATATVTSGTRATLLFLGRDYFEKLVEAMPAVRQYLEGLSDERLMDTRLIMGAGSSAAEQGEIDIAFL